MFDWYEPMPALLCRQRGSALVTCQGRGRPNLLFMWRQGNRHPIDQRVDDECRLSPAELLGYTLPQTFSIFGWCKNEHMNMITCGCQNDVWTESELTGRLDR